jgi:hypothetical protein
MGDVLIAVVVIVVLVVGGALVARLSGRGRPPGGGAATARPGPAGRARSIGRLGGAGAAGGGGDEPEAATPSVVVRSSRTARPDHLPGGEAAADRADPGPAGLDPADVVGPAVERPATAPAAPLAELLRGVELPCGLVPSTGADHPDPDHYLALVTTAAAPDDVGAAMGDELERLGYQLLSLSDAEVVARRGEDLLSLRLHPAADIAQVGGRPVFPAAGPGAVGIELWSGAGPGPRDA